MGSLIDYDEVAYQAGSLSLQADTLAQKKQRLLWTQFALAFLVVAGVIALWVLISGGPTLAFVLNPGLIGAAACLFRYYWLDRQKVLRQREVLSMERVNVDSWRSFLSAAVLDIADPTTTLISSSERVLTEDEMNRVSRWFRSDGDLSRIEAEHFLNDHAWPFSSFVEFCRSSQLQPWVEPMPEEWFASG